MNDALKLLVEKRRKFELRDNMDGVLGYTIAELEKFPSFELRPMQYAEWVIPE